MKKLILCNSAPNYINFFYKLGLDLSLDKNEIIFALESHLIEKKYNLEIENFKKYYFMDYFQTKYEDINLDEKYNQNLRIASYPDYNRFIHWKINNKIFKETDLLIFNLINFFEKIIKDENIEVIIYENVSNLFSYIAYLVAKKNKIKYIGLIQSRLEGRFEIWKDPFGDIEERKELYKKYKDIKLLAEEEKKYREYIENISILKPSYMKNNIMSKDVKYLEYYFNKILNGELLGLLKYYYQYYFNDFNKNSYELGSPINHSLKMFRRNISRKLKIKYLNNKFDNQSNEKYFIYPLHYQPESSTSVNSSYNCNQIEVIEKIAFSLPMGIKLHVKEHPNAVGFFERSFYQAIKKIPNVKYISPNTEITNLIKNSLGVITLTSTVGFEALLMKKNVITIGDVFYNYHPKVINIKNFEDLYSKIVEVLNQEITDYENYIFLKVYFETTYTGILNMTKRDVGKDEIKKISEIIMKITEA